MAKYVLVDDRMTARGEIFTEEYDAAEEAIKAGEIAWSYLTETEKNKCDGFYVLESINPDADAENHLDGTPVKAWKR